MFFYKIQACVFIAADETRQDYVCFLFTFPWLPLSQQMQNVTCLEYQGRSFIKTNNIFMCSQLLRSQTLSSKINTFCKLNPGVPKSVRSSVSKIPKAFLFFITKRILENFFLILTSITKAYCLLNMLEVQCRQI